MQTYTCPACTCPGCTSGTPPGEDPTVGVGGGTLLPVVAGLPRLMGPETSSPAGDSGFVGRGELSGHPGGSTSNGQLPGPCQ